VTSIWRNITAVKALINKANRLLNTIQTSPHLSNDLLDDCVKFNQSVLPLPFMRAVNHTAQRTYSVQPKNKQTKLVWHFCSVNFQWIVTIHGANKVSEHVCMSVCLAQMEVTNAAIFVLVSVSTASLFQQQQ